VESDKTVQVSDEDFRKLIVESLKEIDEELLIEFDGDLMYDLIYKSKSRKPSSNEVDAWGNIDSAAGWDLDDDEVFVKVRKVTVNTKNKEYREMHEMLLEGGGEDKVKVRIQKALDRFMNSFN
jgi:hypothetical protein